MVGPRDLWLEIGSLHTFIEGHDILIFFHVLVCQIPHQNRGELLAKLLSRVAISSARIFRVRQVQPLNMNAI
jgi:hypothetical protein